jgi:NADH-quinone oxidoreductase subunit E
MLSRTEEDRIREEREHAGGARAAVSEALMVLQESRGWVSDEGVAEVADALGLSLAEVESVATSYELIFRRVVGRHVILVCDSVSCWVTGYPEIIARLQSHLGIGLGATTPDGKFSLLPAGCLGACEQAPAMMVDGELFGNLTPDRALEILARLGAGEGR